MHDSQTRTCIKLHMHASPGMYHVVFDILELLGALCGGQPEHPPEASGHSEPNPRHPCDLAGVGACGRLKIARFGILASWV